MILIRDKTVLCNGKELFHIVARTSVEIFRINCHSSEITIKCQSQLA
jgi:hypothetical protein